MKNPICSIRLSKSEFNYLTSADVLSPSQIVELKQNVDKSLSSPMTVKLPVSSVEEFRRALTERLAVCGFDEGYDLTAEGALIEDLLDKFFILPSGRHPAD